MWVLPSPENADRVYAALTAFGAPLDALDVAAEDFGTTGFTVQFGVPPRRIDVLTAVTGLEFEAAWERRFQTRVFGREVAFLSLDDMLHNKQILGRDKDVGDVRAIRRELARRRDEPR